MSLPRLSPRNEGILTDALGPMWRSMPAADVVSELDRIMDFAFSHDGVFSPRGFHATGKKGEPKCVTCGRKRKPKKPL